jgi:hypothetical protein
VHHQDEESSLCMDDWKALNRALGKIDEVRQKMLLWDHEARTTFGINVIFFENIRLSIPPVRVGFLTDKSIVLPIRNLFPLAIVAFCQEVVTGDQRLKSAVVTENLMESARHFQKIIDNQDLKTIYPVEFDFATRPNLIESAQSLVKTAVDAFRNILPILPSAHNSVPSQISGPTKMAKRSEPFKKRSADDLILKETPTASKLTPKTFKVLIRAPTYVVVNGIQVADKEPRMALLGLAVVSKLNLNAPISFSTKELISLIHEKSQGTKISQLWYRYRAELKRTLAGVTIEGRAGHYTIYGLHFETQLPLEKLKADLNQLVRPPESG